MIFKKSMYTFRFFCISLFTISSFVTFPNIQCHSDPVFVSINVLAEIYKLPQYPAVFKSAGYCLIIRKTHPYYFGSLNELFRDTIRLNTSASSFESFASTQKNPFRTNWKLS